MPTLVISYTELFTLSINQSFYQNLVCRQYQSTPVLDFVIAPTDECNQVMSRLNLIYKELDTIGGFKIFTQTNGQDAAGNRLLLNAAKNSDKLTFFIALQNNEMLNFDNLPLQIPANQIFYFTNQISDPAAARNNLHITQKSTGVDGTVDLIEQSSSDYSFHSTQPVAPGTASVKHILTGGIVTSSAISNNNGQADIYFDLSPLPLGKCELIINGVVSDNFYYTGPAGTQKIFGVIELSLSQQLNTNYRIVEPDQSLTPARPYYYIVFNNRSTLWRYTVQLTTTSPIYLAMAAMNAADKAAFIAGLNIVTNDTTVSFAAPVYANDAFVFISNQNLGLKETYLSASSTTYEPLILTLTEYATDSAKKDAVVILPFPDTSAVDGTNGTSIYSNIFLTL